MEDAAPGTFGVGRRLRATIHQVRAFFHERGQIATPPRAAQSPRERAYFSAAICFARISRARSTLRLMPSSRAAWIWLR